MVDYEVGYGKPPKATRFKQGKSGNPTGRPRALSLKLEELMQQALDVPMTYRGQGRVKSATRREVVLRALTQKALKGDVTAALQLFKKARRGGRESQITKFLIADWLPDFPGETADQKNAGLGESHNSIQDAPSASGSEGPQ